MIHHPHGRCQCLPAAAAPAAPGFYTCDEKQALEKDWAIIEAHDNLKYFLLDRNNIIQYTMIVIRKICRDMQRVKKHDFMI